MNQIRGPRAQPEVCRFLVIDLLQRQTCHENLGDRIQCIPQSSFDIYFFIEFLIILQFTFNQMETLIFLLIKITHLIMFKAYIHFLICKQHDLF